MRFAAMAPFSVFDTCDCTATSANFLGRYFRASAIMGTDNVPKKQPSRLERAGVPQAFEATKDISCRCYLSVLTELES